MTMQICFQECRHSSDRKGDVKSQLTSAFWRCPSTATIGWLWLAWRSRPAQLRRVYYLGGAKRGARNDNQAAGPIRGTLLPPPWAPPDKEEARQKLIRKRAGLFGNNGEQWN